MTLFMLRKNYLLQHFKVFFVFRFVKYIFLKDLMSKANSSYNFLNLKYSAPFGLNEINAMNENQSFVIEKECFLSQKIPCSIVSSKLLAERLRKTGDPNFLPNPFIFSPARKQLLNELFPEKINHKLNLIIGVSKAGKSNFACHLTMMLRRKLFQKFQCAVIYIGHMEEFNSNPFDYCRSELFYWFYEEIKESVMVQILMGYAFNTNSVKSKIEFLKGIMEILKEMCDKKKKMVYFIEDQFNKLNDDAEAKKMEIILKSYSDYWILVSTNTDVNAIQVARPDECASVIFELDESKNPIKENEIKKIIGKLFPEMFPELVNLLCNLTEQNINLILMFYNHCAEKNLDFANEDDFLESAFETFSKKYINDNAKAHDKWFEENVERKGKKELSHYMMTYLDLDQKIPHFEDSYLDKRYISVDGNFKIFSINPLISKMMREKYFNPDLIENILEQYGRYVGGSWSGSLFEYYILTKFKSLEKEGKFLKFHLKDNHDENQCIEIAPSKIKKMRHCENFQTLELDSFHEGSCCYYIPSQQNFPLFDALYAGENGDPKRIGVDIHSLKINDSFKKDFLKIYNKYSNIYQNQLKKFFGNSMHFKKKKYLSLL